jgi:hypothetical protein
MVRGPRVRPLRFKGLSDVEIDLLRQIMKAAQGRYYEQQKFLSGQTGAKGDIRHFVSKGGRPNQQFLAILYDYVLGPSSESLRKRAENDPNIYPLIEQLYSRGVGSGRYEHDLNFFTSKVVGTEIETLNVPETELGTFIGYRYRTDRKNLLRFFVQVFMDPDIERTRFQSFLKLERSVRETSGFAYYTLKTGNTYLSGFINNELGCEFIALRTVIDRHIRSGILITTDSHGLPAAKQCVLIDIRHTRFVDMVRPETSPIDLKQGHPILNDMHPITAKKAETDILRSEGYIHQITRLLRGPAMVGVPLG